MRPVLFRLYFRLAPPLLFLYDSLVLYSNFLLSLSIKLNKGFSCILFILSYSSSPRVRFYCSCLMGSAIFLFNEFWDFELNILFIWLFDLSFFEVFLCRMSSAFLDISYFYFFSIKARITSLSSLPYDIKSLFLLFCRNPLIFVFAKMGVSSEFLSFCCV